MNSVSHPLNIEWARETLVLLPERAMWWPRERTLFITDTHFGKASTFRALGIPVPEASHDEDLRTLSRLSHDTSAEHLVLLGDFLHAPIGRTPEVMSALAAWRASHVNLKMTLILGNHDRRTGAPPTEWDIRCSDIPLRIGPFMCHHELPETCDDFTLAGHLHPACRLSVRGGHAVSGRCFIFGRRLAILPAFGSFTGSHYPVVTPDDRVFLVGPHSLVEVPRRGKHSRKEKSGGEGN